MTCVSQRDKGMCSSGIAWVRPGSRLFGRDIECVWGGEGCVCVCVCVRERERASDGERERGREGARGIVCVHKWRIDRERMLMLSEIGL